jgi:hypothetical protein
MFLCFLHFIFLCFLYFPFCFSIFVFNFIPLLFSPLNPMPNWNHLSDDRLIQPGANLSDFFFLLLTELPLITGYLFLFFKLT